jgi:hypothetical protein
MGLFPAQKEVPIAMVVRYTDQRIGRQVLQLSSMNLVTEPLCMSRLQSEMVGLGGVVLTTSHHSNEPTDGAGDLG